MRTVDEHAAAVLALAPSAVRVQVPLREACGLVAAAPVLADCDSPAFDSSAMDGFAVRWADLARGVPVALRVVDESRAGVPAALAVGAGEAIRIMTGALMPSGADTVVAQEVTTSAAGEVTILEARGEGAHVRRRGEDARVGDEVVAQGVELQPRHLAAAATVGVSRVDVFRRPRVGLVSTGDELVEVGTPLAPGQIYESHSYLLEGVVRAAGADPVMWGKVPDSVEALLAVLDMSAVDLVITTGGVSVGDYDVVKEALTTRGVDFVSVAMQPGKPQGLGVVGTVPVVCLPGNPVSVAVSFEVFVAPLIRHMRGVTAAQGWSSCVAGESWASPVGREQFMPVRWESGIVVPATRRGSGSHLMASLSAADGWARVGADVARVSEGDQLSFRWFTA